MGEIRICEMGVSEMGVVEIGTSLWFLILDFFYAKPFNRRHVLKSGYHNLAVSGRIIIFLVPFLHRCIYGFLNNVQAGLWY